MTRGTASARKTAVPSAYLGFWITLKETTRGPCGFGLAVCVGFGEWVPAGEVGVFFFELVELELVLVWSAEPRPAETVVPAGDAEVPLAAPQPVSPVMTTAVVTTR